MKYLLAIAFLVSAFGLHGQSLTIYGSIVGFGHDEGLLWVADRFATMGGLLWALGIATWLHPDVRWRPQNSDLT